MRKLIVVFLLMLSALARSQDVQSGALIDVDGYTCQWQQIVAVVDGQQVPFNRVDVVAFKDGQRFTAPGTFTVPLAWTPTLDARVYAEWCRHAIGREIKKRDESR